MNITEISVKRPAAITILIVLLLGLGVIGYTSMGADLLPSMNIPVITISTAYNGAGAEDIKKDIVKPIEDAVSGLSGVDKINSSSREGFGTVVVQFKMSTDMNSAMMDVQKAIDNVSGKLPDDASKPILFKVDTNAIPILILAVTGDTSYDEMYNQSEKLKDSLEKIPGVGQVSIAGADKKELTIKIDKSAMEYYGVNVNTIIGKLKSDNINMPSGEIKQEKTSEAVRVTGEFQNINEVKNLTIPTTTGGVVRLSDIADVKLEYPESDSILKLNGKKTIGLIIQKQSDANVIETVNNVKKELETIKKIMPKGINIALANDTTVFINSSLSHIKENLIEGIITTAIVLLLFLRSWRSSLIVLVSIPTSLIATFFMMYVFNFTLNIMSLMGLAMCIGILVDDSIVILENIQRHLGLGKSSVSAAIEGRMEIGMAAVAITLCDIVVFAPIAFTSGMAGQFFKQFGLTVVFATLFSLFISFTVTPMLASKLFNKKAEVKEKTRKPSRNNIFTKILNKSSNAVQATTEWYKNILIWSLNNRAKVLIGVGLAIVVSIALLPMRLINTEFMPQSDESQFTISLSLRPGSNLKQTDEKIVQVENYLHSMPEVKDYFSIVGNNNNKADAQMYVQLVPKDQRKKSQSELAAQVRSWGKKLPGIDFNVTEQETGGDGGGSSKPIVINITGDNTKTLKMIADKVEGIVKTVPGVVDVSNSANANSSEFQVKIDRLAAVQYGVSMQDIAAVLRTGIAGSPAGVYRGDDDEYDIKVKFMDGQIKNADDIGSIKVPNISGGQIPLNQVAKVVQADGQQSISRKDRQDVVTISANMQGRALGSISRDISMKLKEVSLPLGYNISYGGSQQQMGDSFSSLLKALAASIVLVYMILVVLYESFMTPMIRMLALPCAVIGAFMALALTGKSLNMVSMIGLIMLDGLASKNGTLLIDYTNTLMKRGMDLKEALIQAGTTRLRPIIMTSATMIVGMLPSALSLGAGSENNSSMSIVIIGGMVTSTLLSPIVLPIVYTLMDDFKKSLAKKRKRTLHVTGVQE